MVSSIIFLRHGETEWNVEGRLQGQLDSPLTKKGIRQVIQTVEVVRPFHVHCIYSSPLGRALQAAQIIQQQIGCQLLMDERLKEINFGLCACLTRDELELKYLGLWAAREKNKWYFKWPDGESYRDVYGRASEFISERLSPETDGTTLIVAHETINKVLVGRLLNLTPQVILSLRQPHNIVFHWHERKQIENIDLAEDNPKWRMGLVYK